MKTVEAEVAATFAVEESVLIGWVFTDVGNCNKSSISSNNSFAEFVGVTGKIGLDGEEEGDPADGWGGSSGVFSMGGGGFTFSGDGLPVKIEEKRSFFLLFGISSC